MLPCDVYATIYYILGTGHLVGKVPAILEVRIIKQSDSESDCRSEADYVPVVACGGPVTVSSKPCCPSLVSGRPNTHAPTMRYHTHPLKRIPTK